MNSKTKRGKYFEYSNEHDLFLRDNINTCESYKHLAEMFNAYFNSNITARSIDRRCVKHLGLRRNENKGQRKKGDIPKNKMPVGHESIINGVTYVKVADNPTTTKNTGSNNRENYKAKHRIIYEQEHGELPDEYDVIFLDGNKDNCHIDNLYAISHKTKMRLCVNKWYSLDREVKLAAIKLCELQEVL